MGIGAIATGSSPKFWGRATNLPTPFVDAGELSILFVFEVSGS